jgi:hypothetical protein
MSDGNNLPPPELWPMRLVFLVALAGFLLTLWTPGFFSADGKPDAALTWGLLAAAVLSAVLMLFPWLMVWTKSGFTSFVLKADTLTTEMAKLRTSIAELSGTSGTIDTLNLTTFDKKLAAAAADIEAIKADIAAVKMTLGTVDTPETVIARLTAIQAKLP